MNKFTRSAAIALALAFTASGVVHADPKKPTTPPPCKEGDKAGGVMVCKGGKWTIPIIDDIVKKPLPKIL
jgi:hypothetical protein